MHFSDVEVGKQLVVGNGTYYDALGLGRNAIRGSAYVEGPFLLGNAKSFGEVVATSMIARDVNEESNNPSRSLHVKGNTRLEGDGDTSYSLNVTGGSEHPLYVGGDAIFTAISPPLLSSRFSVADGKPKPFDIPHPSKKGWRLRHACIEGPEVGVYFRGRLKNDNIIELPWYWKDLVHVDSISVQIQPIGAHQDIIVKRWDEEKIYLQAKAGFPINCFYHVYAERKDINPLIVEYEGDSWKDYPDPNFNPEKVDEEKRTYTDPRFAGPQNTFTG